MNVLVLNCGSSSVKFQLIEVGANAAPSQGDRKLATGLIDRLGSDALYENFEALASAQAG